MQEKFSLVDLTAEELADFKKDFTTFFDSKSLSFGTLVQSSPMKIKDEAGNDKYVFVNEATVIIKKKVPITNESVKKA